MYRVAGSDDPWSGAPVVPGRHKTFQTPAADLETVNDMPDGTGAQKTAKNTAYKQLLADNVNTALAGITGWGSAALETLMDNNDAATLEAGRVDDYITGILGQSYPLEFTL